MTNRLPEGLLPGGLTVYQVRLTLRTGEVLTVPRRVSMPLDVCGEGDYYYSLDATIYRAAEVGRGAWVCDPNGRAMWVPPSA